jgi:hypothetical protein
VDEYLSERYSNPSQAGSFAGPGGLYRVLQREGKYDIPLAVIKKWLKGQEIYTLYKHAQRNFKRRRVIVGGIDSIWDVDLIDFNKPRYVKDNEGKYSYILVAIDILSRKLWLRPLPSKSGADVAVAFKSIFEEEKRIPRSIRSDNGLEFTNKKVQKLFDEYHVHSYTTNSLVKANYSERAIKTIRRILFKLFQEHNSYNYVKYLKEVATGYNSTVHGSTGMAPDQVNTLNEQKIWRKMYLTPSDYAVAFKKAALVKKEGASSKNKSVKARYRYKIGDHVRITQIKTTFSRVYDEQMSREIFIIRARQYKEGLPIYHLDDIMGEAIQGGFYQKEISKVDYNPEEQDFKVDRVLARRTKKGVKESLVSFLGWPPKFNQWLPNSQIKDLGH